MNNTLIKVENLVKTFGGLVALNDCSLEIKDKAITGIIGPNGCLLYTSDAADDC